MAMTQDEFLSNHACNCPHCRSEDITDTDYIWAGRHFVINQQCDICNAEWQVMATITEYCNLELEN